MVSSSSLSLAWFLLDSPIGGVEGVFNAVAADGDFVGQLMVEGRGAGGGPTASATVADLIDIARGQKLPVLGMNTDRLAWLSGNRHF